MELGSVRLDEKLQLEYNTVTATNWVESSFLGVEDNGFHGNVFVGRIEIAYELQDVADAEESSDISEIVFETGREIGGERTVGRTTFSLVSACGADQFGPTVAATTFPFLHFFFPLSLFMTKRF